MNRGKKLTSSGIEKVAMHLLSLIPPQSTLTEVNLNQSINDKSKQVNL